MAIFSANGIKFKVLPTFPANIEGDNGIVVNKSSGTFVIKDDFESSSDLGATDDLVNYRMKIYDDVNKVYYNISLLDAISVDFIAPSVASQGEAEAGTNNDKIMTPLRVKQANDYQLPILIDEVVQEKIDDGEIFSSVAGQAYVDAQIPEIATPIAIKRANTSQIRKYWASAGNATTNTIQIYDSRNTDVKHRAFGSHVQLPNGRWMACYRLADGHATSDIGSIGMLVTDKEYSQLLTERQIIVPAAGRTFSEATLILLPSGSVLLLTSDVDATTNYSDPLDPKPTIVRQFYCRNPMAPNPNDIVWQEKVDGSNNPIPVVTNAVSYCRTRSAVGLVPGDGKDLFGFTAFRALNAVGPLVNSRKSLWVGEYDPITDSLINWVEKTIVEGTEGLSESGITFATELHGIAAFRGRSGTNNISIYKTSDNLATPAVYVGDIPGYDNDVAPDLRLKYIDNEPFVFINFNRRFSSTDSIITRCYRFWDLFGGNLTTYSEKSSPAIFAGASGYGNGFFADNGDLVYFVHKEYAAGSGPNEWPTGNNPGPTDLYVIRYCPEKIAEGPYITTPRIDAASTPGTNTYAANQRVCEAYIKGRQCTAHFQIKLASRSGAGAAFITDLPFPAAVGSGVIRYVARCRVANYTNAPIATSAGTEYAQGHWAELVPQDQRIYLYKQTSRNASLVQLSELDNDYTIWLSITYPISETRS